MASQFGAATLNTIPCRNQKPCNTHNSCNASCISPPSTKPASKSIRTIARSSNQTNANANAAASSTPIFRHHFNPIWRRASRPLATLALHKNAREVRSRSNGLHSLWLSRRLQYPTTRRLGRGQQRDGCTARASMRLDPGGGGRGPNGDNNGIGRVVFNLALAGGLTYMTVTGKLGWLFDAFISLWLLVILVPIVGIVAFLWFADREIVSGVCPNCGNPFQVLEFTMKDEQQFCPYCSQPFKLEGKQFVREGPRFSSTKQQAKGFRRPFGGFGQPTPAPNPPDPNGVIVDVEAEVVDQD